MKSTQPQYGKIFRRSLKIVALCLVGFLAQCSKEEPPPAPQKPAQSLVDQYKDTSKSSAANPGLAGSPGQMKEQQEQKKEGQ